MTVPHVILSPASSGPMVPPRYHYTDIVKTAAGEGKEREREKKKEKWVIMLNISFPEESLIDELLGLM